MAALTDAYPVEEPRYPALARAVRARWRDTQAAAMRMRRAWFAAAGLTDPGKGAAKELSLAQAHAIQQAISGFLAEFRGPETGPEGFAARHTPDGILQELEADAWESGAERASFFLGGQAPELTAGQHRRLLELAFSRLSDGSRMRFEGRLDDIRDGMMEGFTRGDNPLQIAKALGRDLDGFTQGRLRTIVRTEMAISSEQAIRDTYAGAGVQQYEVIGDPTTDATCTSRIGHRFAVGSGEGIPPFHPNCFCSTIPVMTEGA